MKNLFTLSFLGIVFFLSCNENEEHQSSTNYNSTTIDKQIKLSGKISKYPSKPTNLKVGDSLTLEFKLKNFPKDSIYIVPFIENEIHHQYNGIDYQLVQNNINIDKIFIKDSIASCKMKILVPGTFQLSFKTENDQSITSDYIRFSAVKINAWTYQVKTRDSNMFQHSKYNVYFMYSIENGINGNDNYLEQEQFNNSITSYEGKTNKHVFIPNSELEFTSIRERTGGDSNPFNTNSTLSITLTNGISSIEYKDIKINHK
ncbi:MAG: hypothetical protein H6604_01435 [Flavobacteriales bacterium]|nr:hypothetical protein [Flavobacteriales bacterium]